MSRIKYAVHRNDPVTIDGQDGLPFPRGIRNMNRKDCSKEIE